MARIILDTSDYENGLNGASEAFKKAGKTITDAGSTLTKSVTIPVVGIGAAILKTGMDYEAGMSEVQAISGATGDEMTALGNKAMEMAAKTKFSTSDSAEAYKYMAMAGWDASQMVDGLSGIMNLAAASGENLGTTSDIVTDAITAFGLTAADSGRFADVLAAASNNANTNVSMLGESFKYVAPVAGALGYSVEDTSVALGLMANSGIKASQAGATLRTALTNMASPTKNMAAVMEEYGISLTDADGSMLSLSEVMGVLREKMGGLDESTQAAAAATLFGKEAMSGMLAIINAAPEDFDKLTEAINNSSETFVKTKDGAIIPMSQALEEGIGWVEEYNGTTEQMASIMQNNAAGAFERLKSAVNVLFTQLSTYLIPAFTSIVERVTEVINWFGSLDDGTQKLILTIAGVAAAVGPVLVVIGNVITAIGTISGALSSIIGVIGNVGSAVSGIIAGLQSLWALMLANPITIVIAAVAALAAGFVYLWNTSDAFRDFWIDLWEKLKEAASAAWEAITGFFTAAWDSIQSAWNGAGEFFAGVWDSIQSAFSTVAETLGGFFSDAWDAVSGVWDAAKEFFGDIWDNIKEAAGLAADGAREALTNAWDAIKTAWGIATEFFGGIWDNVKTVGGAAAEAVRDAFKNGWDNIKSAWDGAKDFFSQKWEDIKNAFKDALSHFKEVGSNIIQGIWDGIGDKIAWLKSKVTGVVDTIKGWFTGKSGFDEHSPSKWSESVFYRVMQGGANGLDSGENLVMREVNSISDKIKSGLNFGTASVGVNANVSGGSWSPMNGPQAGFRGASSVTNNFNIYNPVKEDSLTQARNIKRIAQQMALGY